MILPTEANTSSSSSKLTSIWLSPDEWMIVSNEIIEKDTNKYPLEESLYNSISKTNLGAVVDVTDQFVLFELEGAKYMNYFPLVVRLILMILKKKKDLQHKHC